MSAETTGSSFDERLARARAARQAARYGEALELLEGCEDWADHAEPATVLRAQILARRAPLEALELLARAQDVFKSPAGRFGSAVAAMRSYTRTRNFDGSVEMNAIASALADEVSESERCTLWHQRAALRLSLEQFDPLDDNIARLLDSSEKSGQYLGFVIRAYMHAGLMRYAEQKADLSAALKIAIAHPGLEDPGFFALQVFGLMRLALETGDDAAFALASDAYEMIPWTEDIADDRFHCVRAMAWHAFLQGENARAQWLLRDAKAVAQSPAWKVMCHADRAFVARANGNESWAGEELVGAHNLARHILWSETRGEERQALVMLAVMFAPIDMAVAQRYVSQYIELGHTNLDPGLSISHDQRAVAFEKYALGRVQQVLGNGNLAVKSLETAYDIFDRAGYQFRAALAATALGESTGEARWHELARSHARAFPNSVLLSALRGRTEPPIAPQLRALSPMQRQIAYALCEGLDLPAMSRRFSRSAYTLGKHVEIIYESLGVNNEKALRSALEGWVVT